MEALLDVALQDAARARAESAAALLEILGQLSAAADAIRGRDFGPKVYDPAGETFAASYRARASDSFEDVVGLLAGGAFKCSGVLVTANIVATAKHCVPVDLVVVGTSIESARLTRVVASTVLHPSRAVDVALLRIPPIESVAIHERRGTAATEAPDGDGKIVGFGTSDAAGSRGEEFERMADVELFGWGCSPSESARSGCAVETEMVVRGNQADTCRGDSGGALFEAWSSGYRLVGITSRALPGHSACGHGGIYTRVDAIADWVRSEIAKESRR